MAFTTPKHNFPNYKDNDFTCSHSFQLDTCTVGMPGLCTCFFNNDRSQTLLSVCGLRQVTNLTEFMMHFHLACVIGTWCFSISSFKATDDLRIPVVLSHEVQYNKVRLSNVVGELNSNRFLLLGFFAHQNKIMTSMIWRLNNDWFQTRLIITVCGIWKVKWRISAGFISAHRLRTCDGSMCFG